MRQLKITPSITSRESDSLDKYLRDISREGLISADEEVELSQRIRKGDREALNELVMANLRFTVSVAKQYQNQGVPLSDLINEGNLGLMKAAEKFDDTRGNKFISFAVWWIRQSILQALSEQSRLIRIPMNRVDTFSKINKAFQRFEQEHERMPSVDEISEELNIPLEKVSETLKAAGRHVSVDAPFAADEEGTLLDVLVSEETPDSDQPLIYESLIKDIESTLEAILQERDREIVKMFFGIGCPEMTLEEIGDKFGLTRERVRQIKEKAVDKLRDNVKSENLKKYLG